MSANSTALASGSAELVDYQSMGTAIVAPSGQRVVPASCLVKTRSSGAR